MSHATMWVLVTIRLYQRRFDSGSWRDAVVPHGDNARRPVRRAELVFALVGRTVANEDAEHSGVGVRDRIQI